MRKGIVVLVGLFMVFGVMLGGSRTPAYAQTLYDDFNGARINTDLWSPTTTGPNNYELFRGLMFGQLIEWIRGYGGTIANTGVVVGRNELKFNQGHFINLKFDANVAFYTQEGCSNPGSTPSRVLAGYNATLFNDGSSQTQTNKTGDVGAGILILRSSDSPRPANELDVEAFAIRCVDPTCNNLQGVTHSLGIVAVGEKNSFQWNWNINNSSFEFQKNNDPVVTVSYAPLQVVTKRTFRNLQARVDAANCTTDPTPFAEIAVFFDNVFTTFP